MPEKVTSPDKIVTDELVLKELFRQGIDKDYVEFWHDYAPRSKGREYSPYAKFYRDLKSRKRIMAVSGLPKVDAQGVKICGHNHGETAVGWEQVSSVPLAFESKPNLFTAEVTSQSVELECNNDQPSGAKEGDKVTWSPQLFLNDTEQTCGDATLLETDPTNQYYHQNVLEWNYGICKRRLRVIEGRVREKWVFDADPQGEVRIKHNFFGELRLRLGTATDAELNALKVSVDGDEEIITAETLAKASFPIEIGASQTFYPDADEETVSVDGYTDHIHAYLSGVVWATARGEAGLAGHDDGTQMNAGFQSDNSTGGADDWRTIYRSIMLFDSSGLTAAADISAAILSLFGSLKQDFHSELPNSNIVSSNPSSPTALGPGDHSTLGSTKYSDTSIAYGDWDVADYNDFAFNASGRAAISKIGVSKFGWREDTHDIGGATPGAQAVNQKSALWAWTADKGEGFKPKLVVTYSVENRPEYKSANMGAKMMARGLI